MSLSLTEEIRLNAQAEKARTSIEHLKGTRRGRAVLALLHKLHEESIYLDDHNTKAMATVVEVLASHQLNGTVGDLLLLAVLGVES